MPYSGRYATPQQQEPGLVSKTLPIASTLMMAKGAGMFPSVTKPTVGADGLSAFNFSNPAELPTELTNGFSPINEAAGVDTGISGTNAGASELAATETPILWPALAGYAAPKLVDTIHGDSMENLGHNVTLGLVGDRRTANAIGGTLTGAAAGAATGAALTAWSGPGAIVGAGVGAAFGLLSRKKGCIIITACTNPHSYEVEVSRKYRDKFMNDESLTGYYFMAGYIGPYLDTHARPRKLVKKYLVDRLVDYGAEALGLKPRRTFCTSWAVTKAFLLLCRIVGKFAHAVLNTSEAYHVK